MHKLDEIAAHLSYLDLPEDTFAGIKHAPGGLKALFHYLVIPTHALMLIDFDMGSPCRLCLKMRCCMMTTQRM